MMLRSVLLACGCLVASSLAQAAPFAPMSLDQAAKLFAARPSAFAADLSPSGDKRMLQALQHAGASADLVTFEGLDHQIDDSDARQQMLTKIGELLDRTIGH